MARDYFKTINIPIELVIDKEIKTRRTNIEWENYKLVSPDEVTDEQKNSCLLVVAIVNSPFVPILAALKQQGWKDCVPFYDVAEAYRDKHPLSNGWFLSSLTDEDVRKTAEVLSRWDDGVSRAHYLQFLAWRMQREEWVFRPAKVNTTDRYFIPEVTELLSHAESFADIGAHKGEVIKNFIDQVNGLFNNIWAVEPDPSSLTILREELATLGSSKVSILPVAVGSRKEIRAFYTGLGYLSQFSVLGSREISVSTIDELDICPSYIKFHLEGWELASIKGARRMLRKQRPMIAVTSYHNDQGIYDLPFWLMENLVSYRFLLRLHSWCGTGAVIYCIPRERGGQLGLKLHEKNKHLEVA